MHEALSAVSATDRQRRTEGPSTTKKVVCLAVFNMAVASAASAGEHEGQQQQPDNTKDISASAQLGSAASSVILL